MDESNEGIYVIHTREFCTLKTNIYKLGRSFKLDTRIKQYPKHSKAMFVINCQNSVLCEKNLINLFKTKFKQCLDYGHEYFQGDINDMIKEIFNYIYNDNEFGKICDKSAKSIFVNKVETKKEREKREKEERKESIERLENKDNKSNIICPKCKHQFKYPSLLKIHFKNSFHCLLNEDEINNYFIQHNNKNNNIHKCNKCLHNFTNIKALNRHNKETKCGKS